MGALAQAVSATNVNVRRIKDFGEVPLTNVKRSVANASGCRTAERTLEHADTEAIPKRCGVQARITASKAPPAKNAGA